MEGASTAGALILVDYQNIHLSGHEKFAPAGLPKHESLIHPALFAEQVLKKRNHILASRRMAGAQDSRPIAHLERVAVYRGLPSNLHDPPAYRRSQAQKSHWTRDRRVEVHYRGLRYLRNDDPPREKGIDVLIAVETVRASDALSPEVIIVASHDTDLEPALDAALAGPRGCEIEGRPWIETAGWEGCKTLRASQPGSLWHTKLGAVEFVHSRDRKDYT